MTNNVVQSFVNCHPNSKYDFICMLLERREIDSLLAILEDTNEDINKVKSETGLNLFHHAAEKNLIEVVQTLINIGTNIHVKTNKGSSPLHLAARQNNVECVKLLLKVNGKPLEKDNYGYNAIDYAKASEASESVQALEQYLQTKGLTNDGLFKEMTIEETAAKQKQTLEKQNTINVGRSAKPVKKK